MIINLWSTPRTGSTWYTKFLRTQYPGSLVINEIFTTYPTPLYFFPEENGNLRLEREYKIGCFFDRLEEENGRLKVVSIFGPNSIPLLEGVDRSLELIRNRDPDQLLIMHNHVAPIPEHARVQLTAMADKNIYIHRLDKRLQLASLAIALSTRRFNAYNEAGLSTGPVADIGRGPLVYLMERIKFWDSIPNKEEVIAYENIKFFDLVQNSPKKLNDNHYARLSPAIKEIIEELVSDYEKTTV